MKKNLLKSMLLIAGLFGSITANAYDFEVNGIYYNITSETNKTVKVTYRDGNYLDSYSGSVVIPASLTLGATSYSVTSIGQAAFSDCRGLTSVTIPNSVTSIDDFAFSDCKGLTSVTIPNSVTKIGSEVFRICTGLTSVTIGNSVTEIDKNAFLWCTGLKEIYNYSEKPQGNNEIVFGYVDKSTCTLYVPAGCADAYRAAKDWKEFTIEEIKFDFEVAGIYYKITSEANKTVEVTYRDETYNSYSGDVVIPASITHEGITYSVTSIGEHAFHGCSNLTSVTIPNSVTWITPMAFYGCAGLTIVTIPNSVKSIGQNAFSGCAGLTSVTIPNSVTSIDRSAFSDCTGLTSVTVGNSVTAIGGWAFSGCKDLVSVEIPNSVTSIGQQAFYQCADLTSVKIGNSVKSIGYGVFLHCERLTDVTIPNSVTEIGGSAFNYSGMKEFIVASDNPNYSVSDGVLFNKDKTTLIAYPHSKVANYTIPNSVKVINGRAFEHCKGLLSLEIPNSVTSIGGEAFWYCANLEKIYNYSEEPQEIIASVFGNVDKSACTLYVPAGCADAYRAADVWKEFNIEEIESNIEIAGIYYNITSKADKTVAVTYRDNNYNSYSGDVVIPASVTIGGETYSVTEIGKDAFSYCDDLASVTIPNSITKIGEQTFSGCTSLACVIIPKSVKEISPTAFSGCTGLEEIYNYSEEPQQVANVFANVNIPNCKLYVPTGYAQTYRTAEIWKDFDIQEFTPTGVEAVTGNEVKIAVVGNTITINGAAETAKVTVYGINGELVYSGVAKSITVPAHGVYIVRVAGVTKKVTF